MKHFISGCRIALPLWAFIMLVMYYGLFIMKAGNHKPVTPIQPVEVIYFNAGDTLLPDYVCADTLIVNDASGLNNGMALIEQGIIEATDSQIDSILHQHCTIK